MRSIYNRYKSLLPHYRDTPEKRYLKIATILVVGCILLMILVSVITFLIALKGPEEILVPDVISTPEKEYDLITAMTRLQEKGLLTKIQLKHSSVYRKGIVVDQRPRAGAVVKAGRRILLTVSEGPVASSVGSYVGKTLQAVRIELQELFSAGSEPLIQVKEPVMYVYSDVPAGTVLEQNPEPGTEVRENEITYVDLVVSKGPKGQQIEIASYLDQPFEQVMEELALAEVPFTFQIKEAGRGERPGVVVDQKPEPGEEAPEDTVIELTMTEPKYLEPGFRFGSFQADLVRYPILVQIKLVEQVSGEMRTILEMRHPGGSITLPFIVKEEAEVRFYVNGVEWKP
jgi:beta-lactam-binding protein with PASTA domain